MQREGILEEKFQIPLPDNLFGGYDGMDRSRRQSRTEQILVGRLLDIRRGAAEQ